MKPLPGARPTFPDDDLPRVLADIGEVLRGGRLILGPKTRELEEAFARKVGTRHAVALTSCTAALEIAYRHARVAGREVIVPTNTFVATANAALLAGAEVVFADIGGDDFCADVDDIMARVTERTAAVTVVHIGGFVTRGLERLIAFCRERRIAVIEDCAHAHGATLDGRAVGSFGDVGCFSLYPTKIITSGVGGVLTTDDAEVAALGRSLRHHGQGASLEEIVHIGNDWLMDEVRAVLGLSQLAHLDEFIAHRRRVAARYDELLGRKPWATLPRPVAGSRPVYYKYPILLPLGVDRDGVRRTLLEREKMEMGAIYSPPTHLMPVYRQARGEVPLRLPVAERILPRQLCLPMHAQIAVEDTERVVAALDELMPG
ncbi:MAG TPA: DegT/DnrJ/EryC1/StrS family aminotransferase [Haliangiales bacterium]|nr:DegT/DnrJ/EryC1/StrS family aminotransferase [Haliangiales bacterium]